MRVYHDRRRSQRAVSLELSLGRSASGSQVVEFSAGLVILVLLVFLPLMDLVIVPVRWMMAQDLVNSYARKLALCESFGQAKRMMEQDSTLASSLSRIGGVSLAGHEVSLRIMKPGESSSGSRILEVSAPGKIPSQWLPQQSGADNAYSLALKVDLLLSPAILLPVSGMSISGLNSPFALRLSAAREWESLGRNPVTRNFFVNE